MRNPSVALVLLGLLSALGSPSHAVGPGFELASLGAAPTAELEARLRGAVAAMAPRVPVAGGAPLRFEEVADFTAMARRSGQVGEAVLTEDRLLFVHHPDDEATYRYELARALLARPPALEAPPWLLQGAALWLAGDWYGRPYAAWLPELAAAEAFPSVADLLADSEAADGSRLLWVPVAAAVVERLPGGTVREKLGARPTPAALEALLGKLEREERARAAPPARPAKRGERPFWNGISFAMLNSLDGGYHAPAIEVSLDRLAALGANAVSIMPFAGQRSASSTELRFYNRRPQGETDLGCLHAARRARARGMTVLWKPQIWVHDSWPGEIRFAPGAEWQRWWASYRRFVLHHALLARWAGAEMLSLGVELDGTMVHASDWRRLIADVRRIFPGQLTYAGNWHGGLEEVPFWDALDVAGVDAYFPLADQEEATPAQLAAGARSVVERLARFAAHVRKPVLLTEVGFAARKAAWKAPHEEGGALSEVDQAAAYAALLHALEGERWLAGVFVWKAFSREPSSARPDFRFLGRPAEREIERFFRSTRASTSGWTSRG